MQLDNKRHALARAGTVDHDRFVGFTFAAANMVVEADGDGCVGYAAGSFRTEFGAAPEAFVGRYLQELVAPVDHEALAAAIWLLKERGRLLPMVVRLANPRMTRLALAGLLLPAGEGALRLCLTLSTLPVAASDALTTLRTLARAAELRMRAGDTAELGLVELQGRFVGAVSHEAVTMALRNVAPNALTAEIGPGRFGVLSGSGCSGSLLAVLSLLEGELAGCGLDVRVAATSLNLKVKGLTTTQAALAVRHALTMFARDGAARFEKAGFAGGLAGYLQTASKHSNALRRAIRAGRFGLMYQPIVNLTDRAVHHYEALIRPLPIPECELATPQEFVLLVESLGLAEEVDLAVAAKACEAAQAARVCVAFNVSGQSAQSPVFRDRLSRLLAKSPACRAGLIGVEMTETAEIEDTVEIGRLVEALRGFSVPFCLDDFGAGAADVRLLRSLRADIVKLDGSYVPGVVEGGRERAFVAGMIEIARAVGAEIVAERVETETEAEALRALGADYGQGWLFGRPGALPAVGPAVGAARRTGAKESWG